MHGHTSLPPSAHAAEGFVADNSPDLHVLTTQDGLCVFASAAAHWLFGWQPHELVGLPHTSFVHPDDISLVEDAQRAARAAPRQTVTAIYRHRCKSGAHHWSEVLSRVTADRADALVLSSIRDIGERQASERRLHHQASTDPLTGVANRAVFMDRLQQALHRLERTSAFVAVLFLDLDRFKVINDSLGHLTGDAVLLQMAERLRGHLRPQDTLARLGGDEFAVVVEGMHDATAVLALGARIVEAGRVPFGVSDETFTCTTSIGVAMTTQAQHGAQKLLQEADMALYCAKDHGRDRLEVFDEDLRTRAVNRLGTERMLRRALDEDRLRVHYQPILDLRTGTTVAAEALLRLQPAAAAEVVAAASFIDVAEETGLLAPMDEWMLSHVLEQAAQWTTLLANRGFCDIAVNLTSRHLANTAFAQSLIEDLQSHGLPPTSLQVEVTERILMETSNSAMAGLKALHAAGVRVGLDDFGTGYSSLSYLRTFPLDFVKIDQSFIRKLATGATERAIVASIIDLSHALGMEVVAEGIESSQQRDVLVTLGCDRGQGFLFAPAGTASQLQERVLAANPQGRDGGGLPRHVR